jgi:anti-anti-sigma factor
MELEIEQNKDVCILHFKGRFLTGLDPEYLRAKSDQIKSCGCAKMLVDLSEVPVMGSTGIGFVVEIYTSAIKREGGRFVMTGATPRVQEVFRITRLDNVIPTAPDVESGIAAMNA